METLDPNAQFTIQSLTREEIAEAFNGIIENEDWTNIPAFEPNDPRLTDEVCRDYCQAVAEAISNCDELIDSSYEYERDFVYEAFRFLQKCETCNHQAHQGVCGTKVPGQEGACICPGP